MLATDWLLHQLSDSAFPAGGFAHSAGLEAAWQNGRAAAGPSLSLYLQCQLQQIANTAIPYVAACHREPTQYPAIDAMCDAFLANHVANRASRAQGQSFVMSASRIFNISALTQLGASVRGGMGFGHFAPSFGAVCRELHISQSSTVRLFLFLSLRGLVSAAVRLGIVGPIEGQTLQCAQAQFAESLIEPALRLSPDEAAQTSPILDLLQGTQDRLYSRLFQS